MYSRKNAVSLWSLEEHQQWLDIPAETSHQGQPEAVFFLEMKKRDQKPDQKFHKNYMSLKKTKNQILSKPLLYKV